MPLLNNSWAGTLGESSRRLGGKSFNLCQNISILTALVVCLECGILKYVQTDPIYFRGVGEIQRSILANTSYEIYQQLRNPGVLSASPGRSEGRLSVAPVRVCRWDADVHTEHLSSAPWRLRASAGGARHVERGPDSPNAPTPLPQRSSGSASRLASTAESLRPGFTPALLT